MNKIDNSQRVAAKVAEISGLLAVVIVIFGNYVLLGPLVVPGKAAETAQNIMAHQTQVRVALTCFLTYGVIVVVLLSALYVILKPVDRLLALIGAFFRLVFALLWLLTTLNLLGALRLVGNAPYLQALRSRSLTGAGQATDRSEFRRLLRWPAIFRLSRDCLRLSVVQIGIYPKKPGCFRCGRVCMVRDLRLCFSDFSGFDKTVNAYWFDSPMAIFELILSVWLLFKGIRTPNPGNADHIAESATKSISLRLPVFL